MNFGTYVLALEVVVEGTVLSCWLFIYLFIFIICLFICSFYIILFYM